MIIKMKTVLLMRHAKSSWKDDTLSDHQRPLNKRGRRDAPRMGQLLNDEGLIPKVIFCSTAQRARATLRGLLETCHFTGDIQYSEALYHADEQVYFEHLRTTDEAAQTALLIGHNPTMSRFLESVCIVHQHMPTAAIAWISFDTPNWATISPQTANKVLHLWTPKTLC